MSGNKDNDKENLLKGNISDRTRSKVDEPTPEKRKQLHALAQIRKHRATGERPRVLTRLERNIFENITEEDFEKREEDEKKAIRDDLGNGQYLNDGKDIVDNFQRGKGDEVHSNRFTLAELKGTQIYMCYGCSNPFREKPMAGRETVPPAPDDIVLKRKQLRQYHDPETKELACSKTPKFCYYHILMNCILKKNPEIEKVRVPICISQKEWFAKLKPSHKDRLRQEFDIRKHTCEEDHE